MDFQGELRFASRRVSQMNVTVFSKLRNPRGTVGCFLMLMLIPACSTTTTTDYVHPKYDFSLIQKIGVLPFENLTQDQQAPERVRKVVVSEILAAGVLDVVEPAQVN